MAFKCHSFSLAFLTMTIAVLAAKSPAGRGRASAGGGGDLCGRTDYQALCRTIVKPGDNAKVAVEKTLQKLISLTTEAKTKASGEKQCAGHYGDAISSLKKSLTHLEKGDKSGLKIKISAAMTHYTTCEDGGDGPNPSKNSPKKAPKKSPLSNTNGLMRQAASNALALVAQLH